MRLPLPSALKVCYMARRAQVRLAHSFVCVRFGVLVHILWRPRRHAEDAVETQTKFWSKYNWQHALPGRVTNAISTSCAISVLIAAERWGGIYGRNHCPIAAAHRKPIRTSQNTLSVWGVSRLRRTTTATARSARRTEPHRFAVP